MIPNSAMPDLASLLRRVAVGVVLGLAAMTANLAEATPAATTYHYAKPSTNIVRDVTGQGSASAAATVSGSSTRIFNSNGSFSVSASATSTVPYVTNVSDKGFDVGVGVGYNSGYAQVFFRHTFEVAPTTSTAYSVATALNLSSASGNYSADPPTMGQIYSASRYTAQAYMTVTFYRPDGTFTTGSGQASDIPLGTNTSLTLNGSVNAGQVGNVVVDVYVACFAWAQGTASSNVQAAGALTSITLTP
ncbi:MAG TPA: hypothetical protein VI541_01735 [Actinomycetota bacterium]|nr:hypothetical protein [Actinomycetota bacterium]